MGNWLFFPVFCHVKMSPCRIHLAAITAMQVALSVALRGLWHKFARSLAQSSTAFGTKADNLARDSTTNVLFLHQQTERFLAIDVSASGLFSPTAAAGSEPKLSIDKAPNSDFLATSIVKNEQFGH
ncbi:hypothetical protein [Comamonas testosteroni]|uniref:hypothetical protein n=1 Tax=Comamonas testosteroni TaxID=285 RepID=UPI0011EC92B2|nr:hypothetical protein [Comamonas testosteroni]